MPHVLIERQAGIRAEADFAATNMSASALSAPRVWSEQWQDRTWHRHKGSGEDDDGDDGAGRGTLASTRLLTAEERQWWLSAVQAREKRRCETCTACH
jgi:hypothetical protein